MGALLIIAALVAGAVVLGGGGRGIQGGASQYFPPRPKVIEGLYVAPQEGPKRIAVPELKWHVLKGKVTIPAIAKQPRFPAAQPGYETVELAVLMRTMDPTRLIVDARIIDATIPVDPPLSAATAVRFWHDVKTHLKPEGMLNSGATEWSERLVRQFEPQHDHLVPAPHYDAAVTLPVQLPHPPNPPLYMGKSCDAQITRDRAWTEKFPDPFVQTAVKLGLAIMEVQGKLEPKAVLFDHDACKPIDGVAYDMREATDGSGPYTRMYKLRLQARGDAIILTAEVARLPIVQVLDWTAHFAVTPLGRFD